MSFKGLKNLYLCKCGHGFVSIDLDEGVTPFIITCPRCNGQATSLCYKIPQATLADVSPVIEWYRPDEAEMHAAAEKARALMLEKTGRASVASALASAVREHVRRGGLLHRPAAAN